MRVLLHSGRCIEEQFLFRRHCNGFDLVHVLHLNGYEFLLELRVEEDALFQARDLLHVSENVVEVDRIPQLSLGNLDRDGRVQFGCALEGVLECSCELERLSEAGDVELQNDNVVEDGAQLHQFVLARSCLADDRQMLTLLEVSPGDPVQVTKPCWSIEQALQQLVASVGLALV